jgi:outer membrane murein-binding lipoprotein Lpp
MGLCVGAYAGSLAVVTVLQIDHDRATIIDRAPVGEAIDMLGRHNDRMSAEIEVAGGEFARAADRYDGVARDVNDLDSAVRRLTARVAAIKGSAMQIPDAINLPAVPRAVRGGGTGNGSSGGSGSGSTSKPKPKATPPPTHGSTGPSGG